MGKSDVNVAPGTQIDMAGHKKVFDPSADLGFAAPAKTDDDLYSSLVDEDPDEEFIDDTVDPDEEDDDFDDEPDPDEDEDDEPGDDDVLSDDEDEPTAKPKSKKQSLAAEIESLREQLAELKNAQAPGAQPSPETEEAVYVPVDIALSDDDFEALQTDRESAQKVLSRMVNSALQTSLTHASEQTLRKTAKMMPAAMARMAEAYVAAAFFRRENRDLAKDPTVLDMVHKQGMKLAQEHPSWSSERLLKESGKIVKARLAAAAEKARSRKKGESATPPRGRVGSSPSRRPAGKLTGLQAELSKLKPGR